jgi:hypothetical protein
MKCEGTVTPGRCSYIVPNDLLKSKLLITRMGRFVSCQPSFSRSFERNCLFNSPHNLAFPLLNFPRVQAPLQLARSAISSNRYSFRYHRGFCSRPPYIYLSLPPFRFLVPYLLFSYIPSLCPSSTCTRAFHKSVSSSSEDRKSPSVARATYQIYWLQVVLSTSRP